MTVLVSDDAEKREKLGKEYNLKSYSYDQFSQALQEGHCDAFYIATPNNQHRQYAVPALEQGLIAFTCLCLFLILAMMLHCRLSRFTREAYGSFSKRL